MSFLNTIRGLGRSSRKGKKEYDGGNNQVYGYSGSPGSPIRRNQSPTRLSPTKQQRINDQVRFSENASPRRTGFNIQGNRPPRQSSPSRQAAVTSKSTLGNEDMPLFMYEPFVKTALVKGSFKTITQLPKYVDYQEWIALNIFEMYNNLNSFYGVFASLVTPEKFPTMNAGPHTNYMWIDSSGQAVNLPAGQYIEFVLTWISKKINDQSIFPTKSGGAFPPTFLKDCKNISRQMFRIFAHIYHNHFETILHLSLEAHWNSFFAHFISFTKEHNLIDQNELQPLLPLIINFEEQGKII